MTEKLSMYDICVPALDKTLSSLEHVLKTGDANATERDIDPSVFLTARLAPDMHHLVRQVQIAISMVKTCPHRIAGTPPPVYEDTEETFDELYGLIAKARKELAGFNPADLNGKEDRSFSVKIGPMDREFTGYSYFAGFTMPNVVFHCTTAYNILRHNGVPLGKLDFFGGSF